MLGTEPTLLIYALVAALNTVQIAAISMPTWVHVLVLALLAGLGAVVNRSQVTPIVGLPPPPPAAPPAAAPHP